MNVFIVGTPHQLLNSIEARSHFPADKNTLIVSLSETYPHAAFEPMLKEMPWSTVQFIGLLNDPTSGGIRRPNGRFMELAGAVFGSWRKRRQLDQVARTIAGVHNLFLGNYAVSYMRHFGNRVNAPSVILVDDGTATLAINRDRIARPGNPGISARPSFNWQLIEKLIGYDTRQLRRVTFFTTYDLTLAKGDSALKNEYTYLRSLLSNVELLDDVFFLGQPMIEDRIIEAKKLEPYLRKVRAHFRHDRVIYIPHRREKVSRVQALGESLGFQVRRFGVPIEYQLSVRGTRPRVLSSFFSSALENCRVIFGSLLDIKCFQMDPCDFPTRREYVSGIYSYYQTKEGEHFEIIA